MIKLNGPLHNTGMKRVYENIDALESERVWDSQPQPCFSALPQLISLLILKHVSITEDNDWSGFMSRLPLPIEQTLLLLIDYGAHATSDNLFSGYNQTMHKRFFKLFRARI